MKITPTIVSAIVVLTAWSMRADPRRDPLTPPEVDQLRDTAQEPEQRLKLYVKFARARLETLDKARTDPQVTDRGQAIHDRLQDFLDLFDELNDNVDTFGPEKGFEDGYRGGHGIRRQVACLKRPGWLRQRNCEGLRFSAHERSRDISFQRTRPSKIAG